MDCTIDCLNQWQKANGGQNAKPVFADPPKTPCLDMGHGIMFDFNDGARLALPQDIGRCKVVFRDVETDCVVYCMDVEPGSVVVSCKKFYVQWSLEVYRDGELLAQHEYSAAGRQVLLQVPEGTLGDSIAWFSYAERFQIAMGCKLVVSIAPRIAELFRAQYPQIEFVDMTQAKEMRPYATYNLGLYFLGDRDHQPEDHRYAGLHHTIAGILGLPKGDLPPRVDLSARRMVDGPYVVIATQASSQAKYWNNPAGWHEVIDFLRGIGYRVVCIDRERVSGNGLVWNHIPWGVEDFTGDRPLQERIDVIKDADCFIGLSSGLSWLAWCCKVPVVLISGFTEPENEFFTPYRVINRHVCTGCWNDTRCDFDHFDYLWCPRHKGTDRQFECTRAITGQHVIRMLKRIPAIKGVIDKAGNCR